MANEEIRIDRGDGAIDSVLLSELERWKKEVIDFNALRFERSAHSPHLNALADLVRNHINHGIEELNKALASEAIRRNQAAAESGASSVFQSRVLLNPNSEYGRQYFAALREDQAKGLFVRAAQIGGIGIPQTLASPMHNNYQGLDPRAVSAIVETYFVQEGIIGRKEGFDQLLTSGNQAVSNAKNATAKALEEGKKAREWAAAAQKATLDVNAAFEVGEKRRDGLLAEWLSRETNDQTKRDEHRQKQFEAWQQGQLSELERRQGEQRKLVEDWTAERTSEIEAAKDALKASFATESAHTYWDITKYARHQRWAIWTGIVGILYLLVVVAGSGFFAWRLLADPPKGFNQPLLQTPISVVALFVLGSVLVIWVGRLLARTYMAHVQLAEDAKERATMIETFIALIRADAMKAEHGDALKTIFRPAASGLLAGDGSPDTPVEVLMKPFMPKKD